jgi:transposase
MSTLNTEILKQVAGIDVAQNELVVSLGRLTLSLEAEIYACKTFANKPCGFSALSAWVSKQTQQGQTGVCYVMEATGVYHEKLAHHLWEQGQQVSIVLPNKISSYMKTLDIKTITDKTAAQAICRFGLERKLQAWQPPKPIFRELRQLTRERDQLVADRTLLKNQLHAEQAEAFPHQGSQERLAGRIALIEAQEREIRAEIAGLIGQDAPLAEKIERLTTIPGVGKLTAVIVLAETNGFELIRSKKQLVSYSGLDVKVKDSGTSVKGKPKISKKGNRHLRKAMYMPALTAIRKEGGLKSVFVRLVSRHGIKMKAAVAVQRKLLELIYTLWKSGQSYQPAYGQPQPHPMAGPDQESAQVPAEPTAGAALSRLAP